MGVKLKICSACGEKKRIGRSKSRCKQCRKIDNPISDKVIQKRENIQKQPKKKTIPKLSDYEIGYLKQPLWLETIRPRIIKRDGNKCVLCGAKKFLQVHHRSYDKDVMNGDNDSKLITLCREHHVEIEFLEYHGKLDPKNKKRPRNQVEQKLIELINKIT